MTCIAEGCTRPVHIQKRGLCTYHYNQQWRANNPDKVAAHLERNRPTTPCRECGGPKERRQAGRTLCAACCTKRVNTRHRRKQVAKYGMTLNQYEDLAQAQDHRCAICRGPSTDGSLQVDHDHTTGAIRGLLCGPCNRGLGHFKDNAALCEAAAAYVEATTSETRSEKTEEARFFEGPTQWTPRTSV